MGFTGQIQQPFEQQHLLGIDPLGGSSVESPQQVLELVLKLLNGAGALLLLLQQLLTLGPQQFILPLQVEPLLTLGAEQFYFPLKLHECVAE